MGSVDKVQDALAQDKAALKETVLDYFEGWFEGDAARMRRSLHPQLAKRTLGANASDELEADTASEMIDATARGVGKTRHPGGDLGIEIVVNDVYDTIATVSVYSRVYREYLHLVRTREGWKIANALWQRT